MSTAARTFNRRQALEKEVKDLYAKVTIGASGAPTLTTGYGFASISKTSTGLYRLTLQDKYHSLKSVNVMLLASSAADFTFQVKAEAVSGATPYIDFFTLTGGTVAEPSNGHILLIKVEVKNTSAI